jgi:hypothetical protein
VIRGLGEEQVTATSACLDVCSDLQEAIMSIAEGLLANPAVSLTGPSPQPAAAAEGPLDDFKAEGERALKALGYLTAAGVVGIVIFALSFGAWTSSVSIATVTIMISGASLVAGGLLGFLFGIPRAPQVNAAVEEQPVPGGTQSSARISTTGGGNPYRANTNLEEISDWLTKILVGVGLVQIGQLPGLLNEAAGGLKLALGNTDASGIFGVAAATYFLICGFLLSYLWTRVYLPRAFRWSDAFSTLTQQLSGFSLRAERDRQALEGIGRQLDLAEPESRNAVAELTAALKEATIPTRKLAFYQALHWREKNAGPNGNTEQIERTIPLWQALIAVDDERKYFRNQYELAMAYSLGDPPDWPKAEQTMTDAINTRNRQPVTGWREMELQRARFVIQQDEGFKAERASTPEQRKRIEDDLRVAEADPYASRAMSESPEVQRWRSLNGPTQ